MGKPEGKKELALYDLKNDIHEDNNVAESNPQIVKKLQSFAESARKDLGRSQPQGNRAKRGWLGRYRITKIKGKNNY